MSSPAPESPSGKKKGLKKRLLRLFSRSEAKEKPRTRSEGDKSCTAGETGQLDRKGRWGRKDRQEPQEGAESLPRLRNPKSEDGILRRSSRETKTRSLSYSELELPSSSFLQRFGSLTWRKKRFSALDYSNASTPTVSTPAQSHWSVGRLDRPAVENKLDLENRRPNSCIVEYPFPQLTPKNSEQSPNREPKTLEVSTSFDCVANDEDDKSSSQRTTKGKNVQLPFPFPERLEGEEEESLPCWAESILKDYMSQDQPTPGSPLHPLSRDSHTLQTMEQHEEPDRYRSPLYHRIVSKDLIQEEHVPPVKMPVISSICIETMEQNKQFDVQQTVLCNAKKIEATERTEKQIPLYNSIPVDVAQIRTGQKCINLSVEAAQNNASSFPDPLKLSTEYSLGKKACSTNNQTSLAYRNNLQDGLQKKIHNGHRQVIVHEPAHSLSESSIVSQAKMKDDCKPQQSPNPAKIRYEVIITMTKEEKEQELLPSLAQELVKAEELVGQDLRMSPSLESRACGCHGAGLTDVTAEEISEISDQTEKNTAQEEEILENKRGGETPKGPQLNRSIRSTVDEEFFITASGSDQVAESCRLYSSNMEKPDNQQKVFELPRTSNKKDNDFTKLSYGHVSPQLYEGHVKGLQKVFENISTKDNVIHHKETPKSQQYGSLREKKHKVPQEMPATPGVHTPVYSKVFNPLRKDHFEKRNEHVIVTVIDGSEKSDTSPVSTTSQINIGSNKKCLETKSSAKKYIENVELTNRYHSGNEASYRKARAQLPDLNLPPRIPTPPPYRTKNNVSISLSSPRGWKNESVIVRSPMSLVAQRFENQRNNFSLNPSQTSANFFFSGGSISHAKSSSELQQNVKKFEENRIQPRDITKSHHLKNSQESNTVDLKSLSTANMLHVVSHIVDEKEALHSKSFEALANTINNEIQEDSTVNKDSGLVDIKERFKDKHVAKRILIEDRHYQDIGNLDMKDLKSRGKEVCVQETMNTSTIDSHLGHDIPPMIIPKRKPPDYLHDAYINHKLKHTLKKKLEDSHDLNKHNASHGMDLNYTTVDSMPVENRDYIGRDLRANQQVKNKHQPTVILCTFVNQVNDSIHLTKRKNNDEIRHYGASLSDQPFEEETKIKLKHEAEELKNNHAKFIQCNVKSNLEPSTNTLYEYQSKTTVNQGKPLTDQSEGEVFTMLNKDEDTVDLETDITSSADNNEEGKTDVPDRADGDLSTVTLNKEVIEIQIELPEIDILEDYNGFEQPVGDIQMDKIVKMAIMQKDKYLTKVTKYAPFNKEVKESHIRQQEIDISEDNAFEQPLGDIQMGQVEKVAIMQNDTYLTEVNEEAPINKEVIESHIRQQEIDISEDNAFEQPLGDIQMDQVEKVAIMQNDTYLTEVTDDAPINKEVIESHIRQQEMDISEDNAFEQPLGDIQMDQVEKVAIMQNDTYLTEVNEEAPINKEVIESHRRQQEIDISEDNAFEQPLGDIQMDQVEKVAIMQNDTYLTEVTDDAPINKEVIESHIRQQEIDISEDNAFEQPLGDIQMDQVEKVAIMQNDTYLTEVTEDAPINKEVIESHIRQQEMDISEDNAFEQPLGDIQMDQVEKVAIMQNDTYLTEVNEEAPINKEVIESHRRQQEIDISEDNAFEQPLGDIQMGQVEKVAIMQNDTYLTEVTDDAPINKEVIESHIRQQEIDISEDNAFEQPLGDIQMDQVEKVAIMQNDTYLTEITEDAPINKEVIESHIRQQEMDISEDNAFVLNKAEDKTGEELSNTEYNNHKVDKEVNNQELHYIVSVTTIDGQLDYVNDFEHNQILRNVGSVDILEQAENEEAQLTDQLVNNVKDGSSLAEEDKSKYEQNINASDLLSTDTLDHALHMDSNPNTVGSTVMGHGQNVEVSVEIKREHMENVSDISENSTVVKNTVTVIQEKTNEMDINTVDMTDQSILIAAVAEDEPVTHETDIFVNDMTVSTEVEQSKEIIKIAESKDPAAQEVIVLVDSSIEISEQTFNNFKEDLDNMLNTDVNANHMSDTHLLHTNTAQTGDVIVDYNNQNTDLLSERHENGAEQALDVISQFVNNKVRETTILVSEEDCGIFTKDKDKVIINPPVNEFVDQTSELVSDQAEQDGNISSAEGLTVDNSNSTGEAAQSTLRQSDKTQNISDILGQNTSLTGQMNQVEKVAIMQNDKCLTKVTEDAVFDKEDALEPGAKKIDMTNERHEHTLVKNTNDSLTCIDSKNSIDDQPSENTQMGKDIANHVTDEISQWKGLDDNLLLSEHKAEHLNDQSPTLYSSGMQTTSQLPETNEFQRRKNIDTHDSNCYSSLKLNGDISGISLLNVEKNNPANYGNMSNVNTIDPQVHQNSVEQTTRIFQHFHLTDSENNLNDATLTEHARNCADEEEAESSENMEMWVSKLRQLETPEFMKYLREPRQPRCSALSMYATLPPIKEDQGSPKSDCFDFRVALPEIKEKEISPEEGESTVETKVLDQTEKSEEDEKKYSWERNTERSTVSSSPLELMRKHSGDEVSRSDSYKAFIAQNISQRQSSIIGSLLLSEKLDKKTDTSEGKSYSRLESSFLLSSYLKPQKDKLEVTKETETVSENSISENDTDTATTNDTLTSTTRDPNQEDNVDGSIPKVNRITEIDSTERPSKLDIPVSSPIKVFPDVWHHPGKSHGKLNPRPGKIILFSEPYFKGHSYQIYSDVGNACEWELQGKISVRIIRGGWLLYEKPYFRGRRVMLLEGDTDLTCPWEVQDKSSKDPQRDTTKPKSWIGSLRHVVRDFQVPRISLFLDENGEGNKITILGATSDSCVNGQPIKTESIIVHSGLWLVYSKPFFEGDPYILEPGGYPNRNAWNGHDSHLCSLQPARIGGPTVEKPNEPKILLFQHPEFKGHSWEVTRDLHSLQGEPNQQGERLTSVGSLKVLGGCWVAYEKEGFHGHQYLLEEGEYQKWSRWGGCTEELGSLRHIRTDFSEPEIILYEKPGCLEGSCLRLNEALADIEVADYGTSTGSIQVLNGVWVAYENVDFSGEQYILEKGIYHSFHDWGAKDSQICAVQPVLQVGGQSLQYLPKIQLFSEPNFHGDCMTNTEDRILLPKNFSPQSCRIEGSSWILYEGEDCCGEQFILVEGDYPTPTAMGCHARSIIQSLKKVPLYFSIPSISLHGLERFEGKELEFTGSVRSLQGEGYNNHVMSVKVASGIWVLYEHSDFRGRQWLLEQTQITNWLLFSGTQRIGSLCPIRQRRVYFRLRNHALGLFLCVSEPAENMKAARVQVSEPREGSGDLWYYEEGRIKNQMTPQMSLQVVGMTSPGTKVVMWSEGRKPIQTWTIEDTGLIMSCLFEGLCLDIKGGHSYDSDHVVVWETAEDRLTQQWDLEVF